MLCALAGCTATLPASAPSPGPSRGVGEAATAARLVVVLRDTGALKPEAQRELRSVLQRRLAREPGVSLVDGITAEGTQNVDVWATRVGPTWRDDDRSVAIETIRNRLGTSAVVGMPRQGTRVVLTVEVTAAWRAGGEPIMVRETVERQLSGSQLDNGEEIVADMELEAAAAAAKSLSDRFAERLRRMQR